MERIVKLLELVSYPFVFVFKIKYVQYMRIVIFLYKNTIKFLVNIKEKRKDSVLNL